MLDPVQALREFRPRHRFLIGIDSDGCAFDTMEVKHKECFIPITIHAYDLQAVSRYARQTAEFVNLYSKWRGINRFPALVRTFDLLAERPEVQARAVPIPKAPGLRRWIETETRLANPALRAAAEATGDPDLERALRWSAAINESVARIVRGVPPFPFVRESLAKLAAHADVVVVSATPGEALQREWVEHGIASYAAAICGQEHGTKAEHLELAAAGRYAPHHVLMIGDAPGDLKAARANGALFYPINPGAEAASWQRFHDEALDRFLNERYAGAYEAALVEEFDSYLPEAPPWNRT